MGHSDALETVFRGFHRTSPGSEASTLRALRAIPELPARPSILDLGCGNGPQTLTLAAATRGVVTAVDIDERALSILRARAAELGLEDHVRTVNASMTSPVPLTTPRESSTFDVIWSEGSIYNVGFREGVRGWRPLLKPGGALGVSELCWLVETPPAAAAAFWAKAYPGLTTIETNLQSLRDEGYDPRCTFTLPDSDWWSFYGPLEQRLAKLEAAEPAPELRETIETLEREIDLYRSSSAAYGYVFFVALES